MLQLSRKKVIDEMKVPKGGKCGVLNCVAVFEEFCERSESIIMGGDRRSELDKAYTVLIDAVFSTIERAAKEHTKTPANVVRFGKTNSIYTSLVDTSSLCAENYHRLHDILSRMKIACLERWKEEAKKKFRSHKKLYVDKSLGQPMEKLSVSDIIVWTYDISGLCSCFLRVWRGCLWEERKLRRLDFVLTTVRQS